MKVEMLLDAMWKLQVVCTNGESAGNKKDKTLLSGGTHYDAVRKPYAIAVVGMGQQRQQDISGN